jgi:hypothetical protein
MSTDSDDHVIVELSVSCCDKKTRTLYVKFRNYEELRKHRDDEFDALEEQFQTALEKRYPGEECDFNNLFEIVRTFTLSEDGKTMKSKYRSLVLDEIPVEINMEV